MAPKDLILWVLHLLVHPGPELRIHVLDGAIYLAAILIKEVYYKGVRERPLMVKVPTVGLLAEHLSPVGDVLRILIGADDKIIAFKS